MHILNQSNYVKLLTFFFTIIISIASPTNASICTSLLGKKSNLHISQKIYTDFLANYFEKNVTFKIAREWLQTIQDPIFLNTDTYSETFHHWRREEGKLTKNFKRHNPKQNVFIFPFITSEFTIPIFTGIIFLNKHKKVVARFVSRIHKAEHVVENTIKTIDLVIANSFWNKKWSKLYEKVPDEHKPTVLLAAAFLGIPAKKSLSSIKNQLLIKIKLNYKLPEEQQATTFYDKVAELKKAIEDKKKALNKQGINFDDHFLPVQVTGFLNGKEVLIKLVKN